MTEVALQAANGLGLVGYFCVSRKWPFGFLIGFASEVLWALWGWMDDTHGIYLWVVVWSVINIYGFVRWTREKKRAVPTGH